MILWSREKELNLRPSAYEADELPDCSIPQCKYYNNPFISNCQDVYPIHVYTSDSLLSASKSEADLGIGAGGEIRTREGRIRWFTRPVQSATMRLRHFLSTQL